MTFPRTRAGLALWTMLGCVACGGRVETTGPVTGNSAPTGELHVHGRGQLSVGKCLLFEPACTWGADGGLQQYVWREWKSAGVHVERRVPDGNEHMHLRGLRPWRRRLPIAWWRSCSRGYILCPCGRRCARSRGPPFSPPRPLPQCWRAARSPGHRRRTRLRGNAFCRTTSGTAAAHTGTIRRATEPSRAATTLLPASRAT